MTKTSRVSWASTILLAALICLLSVSPSISADAPAGFPHFLVPGQEKAMAALRELYGLHYPGAGPKATMWDAWLPMCSLWPATDAELQDNAMRQRWRRVLLSRKIDPQGYVSSHQHLGLAHGDGWPFPLWTQVNGIGWHFTLAGQPFVGAQYGIYVTESLDGWELAGIRDLGSQEDEGRLLELVGANASLTTPPFHVDAAVAPFIRLKWRAKGYPDSARPYLEWTTADQPQFGPQRRISFALADEAGGMAFTHIPTHQSAEWKGIITRLRLNFNNKPGAIVTLASLITACDSRHNINNTSYIRGCRDYLAWTGDTSFLRKNMGRMRTALRFAVDEFGTRRHKCVVTPWVGHDGRSGLEVGPDGKKTAYPGRGIGNNYWDLLPFGGKDCLATIYLYDALMSMAALEQWVAEHPEWKVPADSDKFDPADLRNHAREIKETAGLLFWNPATGRFVAAIDVDGKAHDYGFTFLNCEAIYYGFATNRQARSIVDWLSGKRIVAGDASQGSDIYHWRFGPRSTTRRNVDYYCSVWPAPETIPFGGQVQDGGAVLGFAFHDMMARLATNGPDDAWQRLRATLDWFAEVQAAGGYREYYSDPSRGTLQGGGPPGGLGMDCEFFESALVPQIMLHGFMGFEPRLDGFALDPRLPSNWPSLSIDRIHFHDVVLDVTASRDTIRVALDRQPSQPLLVFPPPGRWKVSCLDDRGKSVAPDRIITEEQVGLGVSLCSRNSRVIALTRNTSAKQNGRKEPWK